jgi:hypothetical protein
VEVMKYCFTRLIDYYNVSLSFVNSEQDLNVNPIIVYFHDLLDIGNHLIDWLILSKDDEGFFGGLGQRLVLLLESAARAIDLPGHPSAWTSSSFDGFVLADRESLPASDSCL